MDNIYIIIAFVIVIGFLDLLLIPKWQLNISLKNRLLLVFGLSLVIILFDKVVLKL